MSTPARIKAKPRAGIIFKTFCGAAPRAMRTPISCGRSKNCKRSQKRSIEALAGNFMRKQSVHGCDVEKRKFGV